jgi:hypothetical protein
MARDLPTGTITFPREWTGYVFEPGEKVVLATVRREMGDAFGDPEVKGAHEAGRALEPDAPKALAG